MGKGSGDTGGLGRQHDRALSIGQRLPADIYLRLFSSCLCNPFFARYFLLVLPSFPPSLSSLPRPPQELKDVAVGQQRKVLEYFAPRSVASVVSTRGRGAQRAGEGDDGGKNDRAGAWLVSPLGPMDFIAESGIIHTFPAFFPPPLPPSLPPSLSPYRGPGADRRPSTLPPPLPPSFPHGGWCPPLGPASQPLGLPGVDRQVTSEETAGGQQIGERGRVGHGLCTWRAHPTASVPCPMPPIPLSFGPGSSEWTGRLRSLLEGKHSKGSKGDGCFWMVGRRERGGEGGQDERKGGKDEALTRESH